MSFTPVWKYVSPLTGERILGKKTLRFSPLLEVDEGRNVPVLNDRTDCDFDFSDEIARLQITHPQFRTILDRSSTLRDPDDTPDRTIEKNLRHQLRRRGIRILSMSHVDPRSRRANPLWGYYGDSAQGVCLEFDQDVLVSALAQACSEGAKKGLPTPYAAKKILYDDIVPKYPGPSLSPEAVAERVQQAAFRKDRVWSHEDEFRIVIALDPDALDKSILAQPLNLWSFPHEALVAIHLGEYCSEKTMNDVRTHRSSAAIRKHI